MSKAENLTPKQMRCQATEACPVLYDLGNGKYLVVGASGYDVNRMATEAGAKVAIDERAIVIDHSLLDTVTENKVREAIERCAQIVDKWNNEIWTDDDRHDPYGNIAEEIRAISPSTQEGAG